MIDILALLIFIVILYPRFLGKWLATVNYWFKYYDNQGPDESDLAEMIRVRAKNIFHIRKKRTNGVMR